MPTRYIFSPQPDITAYELALLLPIFIHGGDIDTFPENCLRHITSEPVTFQMFSDELMKAQGAIEV